MGINSTGPSFEIYCIDGEIPFASSNRQEVVAILILVTINIVLSLAGTVANGLVIMAYYRNPRLRTIQNMLFFVLATTDICVTLVVQPTFVVAMLSGLLRRRDCLVWNIATILSWFFLGISLATIVILTLQSYITLAYPYRFQNIITKNRIKKALAAFWAFISVSNLKSTIFHYVSFADYMCLIVVLSTLICVISTWIWTYKLLSKHRKIIRATQTPVTQYFGTQKKVLRSTVTAFLVTLSLFGCYCLALLLTIRSLSGAWKIDRNVHVILDLVSWTLSYLNSLLNPCLVFWRSSNFRETAKNIVSRRGISL